MSTRDGWATSPGARALLGVGLTQGEVATEAGVSQRAVSRALVGRASQETAAAVIIAIVELRGSAAAAAVGAAIERDDR